MICGATSATTNAHIVECTYRRAFWHYGRDIILVFKPTAVTKFQWNPLAGVLNHVVVGKFAIFDGKNTDIGRTDRSGKTLSRSAGCACRRAIKMQPLKHVRWNDDVRVSVCFSGGVWSDGDHRWPVERRYWRCSISDDLWRKRWHGQQAIAALSQSSEKVPLWTGNVFIKWTSKLYVADKIVHATEYIIANWIVIRLMLFLGALNCANWLRAT